MNLHKSFIASQLIWLVLIILSLGPFQLHGQFTCGTAPNMHNVNLTSIGAMSTITTTRSGQNCCPSSSSRCVQFKIKLAPGLCVTMNVPTPGSTLVWKDNCSTPITVFTSIKPTANDSVNILICKPGNDSETYKFTAVSCCVLNITCPSSNGGLFQCRENLPNAATDTTGFKLLGGVIFNYCDSLKLSSTDSYNAGKGCIGDTLILTRTYKLKDSKDSILCPIIYKVVDNIAPVITCPVNLTINCDANSSSSATGVATATDNCDPAASLIIAQRDSIVASSCANSKFIYRIWTATDSCMNTSRCVQLITTQDTTKPVIICPSDLTVNCDADASSSATGVATATDNCDPAASIVIAQRDSIVAGACANAKFIYRIWTATDSCMNMSSCVQLITTQDTTKPVITCPINVTINCDANSSSTVTGVASATDNCDPAASIVIAQRDSIVAGSCANAKLIFRIWTATDSCLNMRSCVQLITTQDTTKPVIICPADLTINCDANSSSSATGVATATDNCDPAASLIIAQRDSIVAGSCANAKFIYRIWTATDSCMNMSRCVQLITTQDTTKPVIVCPTDLTINCDADASSSATGVATATDNCDPAASIVIAQRDSIVASSCANAKFIYRIWTATDSCLNISSCLQLITTQDTTKPVIVCPADLTINCDADASSSATGVATATDNCDPAASIVIAQRDSIVAGACANSKLIYRIWTATDSCLNISSCVQLITTQDTTKPVIVCPADLTINCDANSSSSSTGVATATDNCDPAASIVIAQRDSIVAGSCANSKLIYRIWTATDSCMNMSSCVQLITTQDTTKPVIICPADLIINCDVNSSSSATGVATATDNCDPAASIVISQRDSIVASSCANSKFIYRIWTATDSCMNMSSCVQLITTQDTTKPVIVCPADLTINCDANSSSPATGVATATDNCDPAASIVIAQRDSILDGSCANSKFIYRIWTATDSCMNMSSCVQLITTQDTTKPVIVCPASLTINCDADASSSAMGVATATDNCDPAASIIIAQRDSIVDGSCANSKFIYRIWTATDSCMNISSCLQLITTQDTTKPVIICPADLTINCDADASSSATGVATATDNCDPAASLIIAQRDSIVDGSCANAKLIYRIWTATDSCMNMSSCVQIITTQDTTKPVIVCPADLTINCDANSSSSATGVATATDNCDPAASCIIAQRDSIVAGACANSKLIYRIWTATDSCMNMSRCVQLVTTQDTTKPVIVCPADLTINCDANSSSSATGVATATDNCDPAASIVIAQRDSIIDGSCANAKLIYRIWTATDSCMNMSRCVQLITTQDTTKPVIVCPTDLTINCDADASSSATGFATATDNCDPAASLIIAQRDSIIDGSCANSKLIYRIWTARDSCINMSSCVQLITTQDTTKPVIICPADLTINCDADASSPATGVATATDNCDPAASLIIAQRDSIVDGACANAKFIYRIWTATDSCLNISSCVQLITTQDTTKPVIVCPADLTINCDADASSTATGEATATDNCDPAASIVIAQRDSIIDGSCANAKLIYRIWTATDSCLNISSCVQLITTQDTTKPVIVCPADLTINCDANSNSSATGVATATDNCDPAASIVIAQRDSIVDGACANSKFIYRIWTATDSCLNISSCVQLITTQDTTKPVIVCPADLTINCDADASSTATGEATATDNCDPAASIVIAQRDSIIDGSCANAKLIYRIWTATDSCLNISSCVQLITTQDTTKPVIVCPADLTINCDANSNSSATGVATATDNCDPAASIVIAQRDSIVDGACANSKFIYRIWTATDSCLNISSCVQLITTQDTTKPVIVCPADLTINCDADASSTATGEATATDNCDPAASIVIAQRDSIIDGSCANAKLIYRIWTATDSCMNMSRCVQLITTQDTTKPVIVCPTDLTINCDADASSSATGFATATDNCDPAASLIIAQRDSIIDGSCANAKLIYRIWTATDSCLNMSSCVQLITTQDTTKPIIICPADLTLNCDANSSSSATGVATATDNCDPGASIVIAQRDSILDGSCANSKFIYRIWTATDSCLNISTCLQLITTQDTTKPVIVCPADLTINCDANSSSLATGVATATDNCDPAASLIIAQRDSIVSGSCANAKLIYRIWTATDSCMNMSRCVQLITTQDTTKPVIICPADLTINCDADASSLATGVATATDNCDPAASIVIAQRDSIVAGSCANSKLIYRIWTATDSCLNISSCVQLITTQDTTKPVIVCPADLTINCDADANSSATGVATATDNCDPAVSIVIAQRDSIVAGSCANAKFIYRIWTATDSCMNMSSCVQLITTQDTTKPVIVCPADLTINCDSNSSSSATGVATATDNCDPAASIVIAQRDSIVEGSCANAKLIYRIWTATDSCMNMSSCVQLITTQDTTKPVIVCPVDLTINCDSNSSSSATGVATATDNCDPAASIVIAQRDSIVEGSCANAKLIYRIWTATDSCMNMSSCVQLITTQDTTRPVIICPADLTINCDADASSSATGVATATDNCDPAASLIIAQRDSVVDGSCANSKLIYRIWTATDSCMNMSRCVQLITTQDTTKPVIICPADLTINCDADTSSSATGVATATDNCDPAASLIIAQRDSIVAGACANSKLIYRIWTATDSCMNMNSCVQLITTQDTTKPIAICKDLQLLYTTNHYVIITADSINNGSYDNCSTSPNISKSIDHDTIFCNRGDYYNYVTLTVTDECGNSSTCLSTVTLIDVQAPEIFCPISFTVNLSECECFANLLSTGSISDYITSTDNCDTAVTLVQLLPTEFGLDSIPPGIHIFSFMAVDDFGNRDTCEFTITVLGSAPAQISCRAKLNVSLDEFCEAKITAQSLIIGKTCAEENYIVQLMDEHNQLISGNRIDYNYLNNHITAKVSYKCTQNSCWSTLYIEDKLAPILTCTLDTISCGDTIGQSIMPRIFESCPGSTLELVDEREIPIACQDAILGMNIRKYRAKDASGNYSEICSDTTYIRRISLDSIYLMKTEFKISCDSTYQKDKNGNPHPSSFGSPMYRGNDLYLMPSFQCNLFTNYTDHIFSINLCHKKIIRTWTIREWWCNTERTRTFQQLFEIIDNNRPEIIAATVVFNSVPLSGYNCKVGIITPIIEVIEDCSSVKTILLKINNSLYTYSPQSILEVEYGVNKIEVIATDQCGNSDTLTQYLEFKDTQMPTPICDHRTVVSLNGKSQISVPSSVFDNGSYDNCSAVRFEARRMTNECGQANFDQWSSDLFFCCNDIGKELMISLKVIDENGNENTCMVRVEVQDKSIPIVQCLPDITVDCNFPYDINHLDRTFGKIVDDSSQRSAIVIDTNYHPRYSSYPLDGFVIKLCGVVVIESIDTSNFNSCQTGYLKRNFLITDAQGNIVSCSQKIQFVKSKILSQKEIVFPFDLDTTNICGINNFNPSLLAPQYSFPRIIAQSCSSFAYSYKDEISQINSNCYTIQRIWSVIDWCEKDVNNNFIIYRDTQLIKNRINEKPLILSQCKDTMICTYDANCSSQNVSIQIQASDYCSASTNLKYKVKVDFNSDGSIDLVRDNGNNSTYNTLFPLGLHKVIWEVEDGCGNFALCEYKVNVMNCKAPTVYCHPGLNVVLSSIDTNGDGVPDVKEISVNAKDLDAGSNHPCGYSLKYSFSRDIHDTIRTYGCTEANQSVPVSLFVTDINGNWSECKARIFVQDDPSRLPHCTTNAMANVTGFIHSSNTEAMKSVEVILESTTTKSELSIDDGRYIFNDLPTNQNYIVRPVKNQDWLNGVTTADIVKIQKHILGIQEFKHANQYIAADVNNSNSITAKDISDLRKLILGVTAAIPSNTSWKFIDKQYSFDHPEDALLHQYPMSYTLKPLLSNMNIDFTGIKIGDVNESAKASDVAKVETRSSEKLIIDVEELPHTNDDEIILSFSARDIERYEGFQFTINFNADALQFVGLHSNGDELLTEDQISTMNSAAGIITCSWNGDAFSNNKLFNLIFKKNRNANISDHIVINSLLTPALAIPKSGELEQELDINFITQAFTEFYVKQNMPNPWNKSTDIEINLPQAGQVDMKIFDFTGRLVSSATKKMPKGISHWTLDRSQFIHSGVYFYQINSGVHSLTQKMIVD